MNLPTHDLFGVTNLLNSVDLLSLAWSQLWQVTVLAAVVGVVVYFAGRQRPHLAHMLWLLVILKCLTPPLWSSPTSVFSWAQARIAVVHVFEPAAAPHATTIPEVERLPVVPLLATDVLMRPEPETPPPSPSPTTSMWRTWFTQLAHPSWPALLALAWCVGAVGLAAMFAWKWWAYRHVLRCSELPVDPAVEMLADRLAARLALRRKPRVLITAEPIGPAVFGFLRPVVVLPHAITHGKAPVELEPILAHELVHLRRGDTVWGMLQLATEVLWWFHPCVWWANRDLCRQRERCCDEEVVAGLQCRPATYARSLLDVLEARRYVRPVLVIPGVQSLEITSKRLEDIMTRADHFHARTPRWTWAVLLLAALLVLPGGALVLNAQQSAAAQEREAVAVAAINHAAMCLAFSPDGRTLAGGMRDGKLIIWDAVSGNETSNMATGKGWVRAVAFLPDGENVLTVAESVQQWNAKTGQCVKRVELEDGKRRTHNTAFSHAATYVAATAENTLWLWDANTGHKKFTCPLIGLGLATAFSPDDQLVAVGTMVPMGNKELKSGAQIWDVQTGQLKRTILEPLGSIGGLAFSHDGKTLAGGTHREVILWDVETGAVQKRYAGGHGPIESLTFSPDDQLLAAGGQGLISETPRAQTLLSELNVWNLATDKIVWHNLGSLGRYSSVVLSPNGKLLAACDDREVVARNLAEEMSLWRREFSTETAPVATGNAAAAQTIVSGQVLDDAGKPLVGARVAVLGRSRQPQAGGDLSRDRKTLGAGSSDGQGRFRMMVPRLSSDKFFFAHVVTTAAGYAPNTQPLNLDSAQLEAKIHLAPEQVLRGRVVDPQGAAAANARIIVVSHEMWLEDMSSLPGWPAAATTDDQGCFTVHGVNTDEGAYVAVVDERFAKWYFQIGRPGTALTAAETRAKHPYVFVSEDFVAQQAATDEVTLAPPAAQVIAGQIVYEDTQKPVAHAHVTVYAQTIKVGSLAGVDTQADAEGKFRIVPYPGVYFHVTAYPPAGQPYLICKKDIEWAAGANAQPLTVALARDEAVVVHGKIVDASSGKPVAGASVQYKPYAELPEGILTGWEGAVLSDAEGNFQIAAPSGRGTLFAYGPTKDYSYQTISGWDIKQKPSWAKRHYVHGMFALDLKPGVAPAEATIAIRRGVTITGRIVDPAGQPVAETLMLSRLSVSDDVTSFRCSPAVAHDGQFELHGFDPDATVPVYFLDAQHELGAVVEISGQAAEKGPLVVQLQPCGKANVRFVTPDGKPAVKHKADLQIVVTPGPDATGNMRKSKKPELASDQDFVANFDRAHYWDGPVTDEEGRCTLPALIPGASYRFNDFYELGAWNEKEFSVQSGETAQLPDMVIKKIE